MEWLGGDGDEEMKGAVSGNRERASTDAQLVSRPLCGILVKFLTLFSCLAVETAE